MIMIDASLVVLTLVVSLGIQAIFFVFAATLKTDKVTDLSYSLTFITLALILLARNDPSQPAQLVLAMMVIAWGIRLATYLLYRIVKMKRDPRFDGVRENFWKFFQFWLFQGLAVWLIMLPVTVWFGDPGGWSRIMSLSVFIWAAGLVIETVADLQKFHQKSRRTGTGRWMESGLWRYSRHPNYFGELLCWWGVFLFVAADLEGWAWLSLSGPITLTCLLLFVTGIPTLERSGNQKWGNDPDYQAYRRNTSLLVPWPPRRPAAEGPR